MNSSRRSTQREFSMNSRKAPDSTDALILGGGVAGLTAAFCLAQQGATVAIVSDGSGASPFITGFDAPVSQGDDVPRMISDAMKSGCLQGDPELTGVLCDESARLVPFLEDLGFSFDRDGERLRARQPIGASFPRVIGCGNLSGEIICGLLRDRLGSMPNVTEYRRLRAVRLLAPDRRVRGAVCFDRDQNAFVCLTAQVTVLACGGFCNLYPFSTNTADIGGDCVAMAYLAGAPLTDLEFVQFEPSAAVWPEAIRGQGMITTLLHEGAVILNASGERFMLRYGPEAERVNKDVLAMRIFEEIRAGKGTPHGGVWFDATAVGADRLNEAYAYFMYRYRSVGIDLACEPVELAPAAHTSLGGAAIDADCRTGVPGLLACGEAAGHIHGANRIGGMAGTETLVFGRRAAQTAAGLIREAGSGASAPHFTPQEALREGDAVLREHVRPAAPTLAAQDERAIRADMDKTLDAALNIVRDGETLEAAAAKFRSQLRRVSASAAPDDAPGHFSLIRLENDLLAARLLALSALARTDSVGCHTRSDAAANTGPRYRTEVTKGPREPRVRRVPL